MCLQQLNATKGPSMPRGNSWFYRNLEDCIEGLGRAAYPADGQCTTKRHLSCYPARSCSPHVVPAVRGADGHGYFHLLYVFSFVAFLSLRSLSLVANSFYLLMLFSILLPLIPFSVFLAFLSFHFLGICSRCQCFLPIRSSSTLHYIITLQ